MGTIIISAVLLGTVISIIISMVKKHQNNKKSGTGGCGCGCSGCSGSCH